MRNSMTASIDHNKLLTKIAKEKLQAQGIQQKGQSRLFIHDNYWYTIIIEFQPSAYDKGTFLNVAADFNFYPRGHFTYTVGGREKEFIAFQNETQFAAAVNSLCDVAVDRVNVLKKLLVDYSTAQKTIIKELNPADSWNNLDIAFVCALDDNILDAKNSLNKVLADNCQLEYEFARKEFALMIQRWFDLPNLSSKIDEQIKQTRKLKKLDK